MSYSAPHQTSAKSRVVFPMGQEKPAFAFSPSSSPLSTVSTFPRRSTFPFFIPAASRGFLRPDPPFLPFPSAKGRASIPFPNLFLYKSVTGPPPDTLRTPGPPRGAAGERGASYPTCPASSTFSTMPPPRHFSPSYSTALCPGVTARWGTRLLIRSFPSASQTASTGWSAWR